MPDMTDIIGGAALFLALYLLLILT